MRVNGLRKTFVAGLLVAVPVALTIFIFIWLFHFFDGFLSGPVTSLLRAMKIHPSVDPIPGVGLVVLILVVFLTGSLARNYFGGKLLSLGDYIVTQIPLINRIYVAIREISESLLSEKGEVLKKAVLIEYPSEGLYSIAFFTQDTKGAIQDALDEDVVSLFLPTTPNPTTGFLLFVPKNRVMDLDMSVEDALKLVISGGSIRLKEKQGLDILSARRRKKSQTKNIVPDGSVSDQPR
jgi:uncharacterized membrane protein